MKNTTKKTILLLLLTLINSIAFAQVGVGTSTPDASAALEVTSTTKGFLLPRMTETQITAIADPAEGLLVYCTDCSPKGIYMFDGLLYNNIIVGNTSIVSSSGSVVVGGAGAIWMDRNLGASQVATSSTDADSFGDLYQWGRNTDGHQMRTSSITAGPVASGNEGSNFVTSSTSGNWLSAVDASRWNGANKGIHDPCPDGFRVPTRAEWDAERVTWPFAGPIATPLKLPNAGFRDGVTGVIREVNTEGRYCTSTLSSNRNTVLVFGPTVGPRTEIGSGSRGHSVRCIKE
ncbi:fibrobacter succinogenes major paralogous domain-containing protein [Tenacibaculum agarivorans]|uniref:hypothetical protein n=1 Tax=Tenacibaculum agarivorans TaxID=1908389 RepID=UPI00094BC377|nr:hypothetical protein [Tenacibaculum agarivorans]